MNDKLTTINDLKDIAKSLRDRQEEINAQLERWKVVTTELIVKGSEQGREIVAAKAKLTKAITFKDWLYTHVPNVSEKQAAKYERLANENITDIKQGVFAFLEQNEAKQIATKADTSAWQKAHGQLRWLMTIDLVDWPPEQIENTKCEAERFIDRLGGKVVWG